MSLYKRIHEAGPEGIDGVDPTAALSVAGEPAENGHRRDPVLDQLRQKIYEYLVEQLGPVLFDKRMAPEDLRQRVSGADPGGARPGAHADVRGRQDQPHQGHPQRHPGLRPHRRRAQRRHRLRGHGQRPRPGLRRAERQAHQDRRQVHRRRPPAAHHREDLRPGRPHREREGADGGRPAARRLPCERHHPAAGHRRPVPHHPKVLQGPVPGRRPDPLRHPQRRLGPVPAGLHRRPPERDRLRRYRHR